MSFVKIGEYWKTQLDSLKASNNVVEVYNYLPREVKTGPYIVIIPTDGTEVLFDQVDNANNYPFLIKIIQNNIDNEATSEADVRDIADKVFDIVRKNFTFTFVGGKVYKVNFTYSRGRSDTQYKMRICDLLVNNFVLDYVR